MVEKEMEVGAKFPHETLEFMPRSGADFYPVQLRIPKLSNHDEESSFREKVIDVVHERCGQALCQANVVLDSVPVKAIGGRRLMGAKIYCDNSQCPLIDPPDSGDREPRPTGGTPPPLEAEVPLPTTR